MFTEDNSGFVLFPHPNNQIVVGKNIGKTLIYLCAFEPNKVDDNLSNVTLEMPGVFNCDDMSLRPDSLRESSIDDLITNQNQNDFYDMIYFPKIKDDNNQSIEFISIVCIGWHNLTFEYSNNKKLWNATFRDLTNEGKRLYYSLKKLHNNKEVRILTFNHI